MQKLLWFWTFLFGLGALIFYIFPVTVIDSLNFSTKYFPFLSVLDEKNVSFWLPLAVSLMALLTLICYLAAKHVDQAQALVVAILLSKATSSLVFFSYYLRLDYPAPFFWGALTDGVIFLITFFFYRRAFYA